ncbi:hypothetical protein [Dasineura jujubifolia toursvirus 2a]|nr:hypothetical protein [Dasineura jujubifolia toursvirus 2a]
MIRKTIFNYFKSSINKILDLTLDVTIPFIIGNVLGLPSFVSKYKKLVDLLRKKIGKAIKEKFPFLTGDKSNENQTPPQQQQQMQTLPQQAPQQQYQPQYQPQQIPQQQMNQQQYKPQYQSQQAPQQPQQPQYQSQQVPQQPQYQSQQAPQQPQYQSQQVPQQPQYQSQQAPQQMSQPQVQTQSIPQQQFVQQNIRGSLNRNESIQELPTTSDVISKQMENSTTQVNDNIIDKTPQYLPETLTIPFSSNVENPLSPVGGAVKHLVGGVTSSIFHKRRQEPRMLRMKSGKSTSLNNLSEE